MPIPYNVIDHEHDRELQDHRRHPELGITTEEYACATDGCEWWYLSGSEITTLDSFLADSQTHKER
jgi:hypothetical protein